MTINTRILRTPPAFYKDTETATKVVEADGLVKELRSIKTLAEGEAKRRLAVLITEIQR